MRSPRAGTGATAPAPRASSTGSGREDSAELIYHEFCLAEASDLDPDPGDYLRRFPDHVEALGRLFQIHSAFSVDELRRMAEPSGLPVVGDEIGPYRLVRKLGEGSFARVFLAEQVDLEDRPVVLKVSSKASAEPRLLARAGHAHIVPVIRHGSTEDGSLHLVCMPYLGGATLGDLLAARAKSGRVPRGGADLLADLDRVASPGPAADRAGRPARDLIAKSSYPRALAWIVARLAEALDHAHRRGVSHGDLKPSNILLTADGVPMLFDFNLAVDWRDDLGPGTDAGGTLAYMAPERLRALVGRGDDRPTRGADRHRADLYGLGLVLREALTGRPPELPGERPQGQEAMASALLSLREAMRRPPRGRWRRPIPPALAAILARCLAPAPGDRYARGIDLADDLDRWRLGRPLAFADEPRSWELATQARRYRVAMLSGVATLAIALGVGATATVAIQGTLVDQAEDHQSFLDRSDAGVFPTRWFGYWGSREQGDPAENARRQLNRYGVLGMADWTLRDDIRHLPARERGETEAWIVEQIWRLADAVKDRPDSRDDWRAAAARIDRTVTQYPLEALRSMRLALAEKIGDPTPPDAPGTAVPPPRWMDAYLKGVAAEADHARLAYRFYLDALESRPDFFWANYRASVVACRINDYPAAARHLKRCVERRPDSPALHAHLAGVLHKINQPGVNRVFAWDADEATKAGDALAECEKALALDPEFSEALATRMMIRQAMGQFDDARSDIDRFALLTKSRGESRAIMLRFRSHFHQGPSYAMPTFKNDKDPLAHTLKDLLARALAITPDDDDVRVTWATTLIGEQRTDEALAELAKVIEHEPKHLRALYLHALTGRQEGHREATDEFARLIDLPRFEELFREDPQAIRAYHYVATDLLNRGQTDEALALAKSAMVHLNRMGLIQRSSPLLGESHYLLARILASSKDAPDRLHDIVDHLGRAFAEHPKFRDNWFATDHRFDALRATIQVRLVE